MSSAPALRLENVSKTFAGVAALQSVDFEVNAGEVHCLAGENGCGKSTQLERLELEAELGLEERLREARPWLERTERLLSQLPKEARQEVAEALTTFPDIEVATVFGVQVPGADGNEGRAVFQQRQRVFQKALTSFDNKAKTLQSCMNGLTQMDIRLI